MEGNPPTRDNSPSYKQGLRRGMITMVVQKLSKIGVPLASKNYILKNTVSLNA